MVSAVLAGHVRTALVRYAREQLRETDHRSAPGQPEDKLCTCHQHAGTFQALLPSPGIPVREQPRSPSSPSGRRLRNGPRCTRCQRNGRSWCKLTAPSPLWCLGNCRHPLRKASSTLASKSWSRSPSSLQILVRSSFHRGGGPSGIPTSRLTPRRKQGCDGMLL